MEFALRLEFDRYWSLVRKNVILQKLSVFIGKDLILEPVNEQLTRVFKHLRVDLLEIIRKEMLHGVTDVKSISPLLLHPTHSSSCAASVFENYFYGYLNFAKIKILLS